VRFAILIAPFDILIASGRSTLDAALLNLALIACNCLIEKRQARLKKI
jgi:hypothetical protein